MSTVKGKTRTIVIAAAGVALALVLYSSRTGGEKTRPESEGGRAANAAPLRAAGLVVEPSNLRETVQTVGTLAANESVRIVGEIPRRLDAIHVEEGKRVAKGDLLFELDDADLKASLAELEVRRNLARRTVERHRTLIRADKRALSQQAFDQSQAELQTIDAQIASLRVTLAKTKIRAPFAGTVGLRNVSEGAWVTPETVLTTLTDTSRVKIDFTLPERYAQEVEIGGTFQFRLAGREEPFTGTLTAIEPVIAADTRSLLVRGMTDNPGGLLFPGGFVSVELPVRLSAGGVLVPAEAVVPSVQGHGVFVLRNGRAELQDVEIGVRTAEAVQILKGLAPGETVLTTNLLRLQPGAAVELEGDRAGS